MLKAKKKKTERINSKNMQQQALIENHNNTV